MLISSRENKECIREGSQVINMLIDWFIVKMIFCWGSIISVVITLIKQRNAVKKKGYILAAVIPIILSLAILASGGVSSFLNYMEKTNNAGGHYFSIEDNTVTEATVEVGKTYDLYFFMKDKHTSFTPQMISAPGCLFSDDKTRITITSECVSGTEITFRDGNVTTVLTVIEPED